MSISLGCNLIGKKPFLNEHRALYAELKSDGNIPGEASNAWTDWRREWIVRDFNIVNDSAKNVNVNIYNLKNNAWYKIFKPGIIGEN